MRRSCLLITVGTAIFSAGCGDSKPPSSVAANAPPSSLSEPTLATTRTTTPNADDSVLVVTGPIIVEHQLDLTAQRDGVVEKVYFDTPTRVDAGALLAQMDARQLNANLEAARAKTRSIEADLKNWEAETEVLKADYARARNLSELGLISEEQLQHAKFKVDSDQWDIKRVEETLNTSRSEEKSLELELDKSKVIAPFGGVVARRYIHEGQNVAKGERLFWLTSEAPLLLRFTLPERYFGRLKREQEFEVTSPDVPGEKHLARVREISPVIDPSSGTFEVMVALTGSPGAFHPGMTANLRVENPR